MLTVRDLERMPPGHKSSRPAFRLASGYAVRVRPSARRAPRRLVASARTPGNGVSEVLRHRSSTPISLPNEAKESLAPPPTARIITRRHHRAPSSRGRPPPLVMHGPSDPAKNSLLSPPSIWVSRFVEGVMSIDHIGGRGLRPGSAFSITLKDFL
ncbi:hypothetical protein AAFF_G00393400 [Aldrovandia affinis]|uniref:Uncharacterized protein n=1 Tax=Aldrovandia affinis TaxID=143900 RepID=A0AAD7WKP3_9TELE|nr:hypothetical protein AAFF_G00393400 [Aldrovandia affinis]